MTSGDDLRRSPRAMASGDGGRKGGASVTPVEQLTCAVTDGEATVWRRGDRGASVALLRAQLSAVTASGASAAPTDTAPTDAAVTDAAPTDAAPTDTAPTDTAPTDAALTDAAPTDAMDAGVDGPDTPVDAHPSHPHSDPTQSGSPPDEPPLARPTPSEPQLFDPLLFDGELDRAVRAFQQRRGLIADGLVGPETRHALAAARWRLGDRVLRHELDHPMHGDDVADLQSRLLGLGLGPERVDGVFGPRTEQGVRDFQRGVGLPADGVVGPTTLRGLDALRRSVGGGEPHALREQERVRRSGHQLAGRTIVLDPGHGGADLGACAHGIVEADLVLDLARRVETRFVAHGVHVVLTRAHGSGGDEGHRADLANAAAADLVVSLHCDAADQPAASGLATFYYGMDRFGAWSVVGQRLADLLQRELTTRTGMPDCRSHPRGSALLQRTEMPAVRVEVGYATNSEDAARLADPLVRDALAEGIVVAVQRLYLGDDDVVRTGVFRLAELRALMAQLAG